MGSQIPTWCALVLWLALAREGFLTGLPRYYASTSNLSQRQGSSLPPSVRGAPRQTQKSLVVDYPVVRGSTPSGARIVPEWCCHTLGDSSSLTLGKFEMVVLDLLFLHDELAPEEPPRDGCVLESPCASLAKAPLPGGFRMEPLTLSLPPGAAATPSSPPQRGQTPSIDACSLGSLVSMRGGTLSPRHSPLRSVGGMPPCRSPSVHPSPRAPPPDWSLLAPLQAPPMASARLLSKILPAASDTDNSAPSSRPSWKAPPQTGPCQGPGRLFGCCA